MESEKKSKELMLHTIQMDLARAEGRQTIETIPSDILVPILSSLPYRDRLTGARVSSRWHRIIDERVGRKLFIGRPCQFAPSDEERYKHHYVPIEAIGGVGANTVYFGEVEDSKEKMNPLALVYQGFWELFYGPQALPSFKNPNLVQNLFFDGPIPADYFRNIIKPVRCLERLDLHTSALAFLSLEDMDFSHLRRLAIINVWGHRLTQGVFLKFIDQKPIPPNLIEIWNKNYFPSLKKVSVEYPFDFAKEYVLTEKLFEFLERHQTILEDLRVVVNCYMSEDESQSEEAQFSRRWRDRAKAVAHQLSLKHVEMEIITLSHSLLYTIWIILLEEQNKLETVSIVSFNLSSSILEKICEKNFQTIKKLTLSRMTFSDNDGIFRSIPFSCFQNCTKLEAIIIEGMQYWANPEQMQAGMTGAENLPQSLKNLDLTGIILKTDDTHYILTQLMNLQKVCLNSVGHKTEFGVTRATVQEVISTRRIGKVSLFHSLIDGIPEGGFPTGNPADPSAVIRAERSLRSSGGHIDIELGEDGYYKDSTRRPARYLDLEEWEGS